MAEKKTKKAKSKMTREGRKQLLSPGKMGKERARSKQSPQEWSQSFGNVIRDAFKNPIPPLHQELKTMSEVLKKKVLPTIKSEFKTAKKVGGMFKRHVKSEFETAKTIPGYIKKKLRGK